MLTNAGTERKYQAYTDISLLFLFRILLQKYKKLNKLYQVGSFLLAIYHNVLLKAQTVFNNAKSSMYYSGQPARTGRLGFKYETIAGNEDSLRCTYSNEIASFA